MARFDYDMAQVVDSLLEVGLRSGDIVFSHSNIGFFGIPRAGHSPQAMFDTIYGAFKEVLGRKGTLVVPTFTYSFCNGEVYDPEHTASTCGMFTEMVRKLPNAARSNDPIFSVCAVGKMAKELTRDVSDECFGPDSFWDRLLRHRGLICNLNFDAGSTFVHYVEKCLGVPYRFDKAFSGAVRHAGIIRNKTVTYFCRDLDDPRCVPAFEAFDSLARKKGLVRSASVGRGAVVTISAENVYNLVRQTLPTRPFLLTEGDEWAAVGTGATSS